MEDMSGDLGAIMNAPALPKPPRYKGSSMQERRYFLRAYYTYFHALKAFQTEHNRPFVKTVGSCIEQAKKTAFEDYAALDVAMKKLSVDTKLVEAESRVNRLQANMYKILEDHNMVDVMFDREQKKLVKYLVAGLEPATFREEIQRRIDQEQNKRYKSNVIEFSKWLTQLLASFMQPDYVLPAGNKVADTLLFRNNSCGKSRVLRMNLSVTPRAQVLIAMNILSRERSYLRWVVLNGTLN
ncbi:hypothetical protein PC118_g13174 [Phytophthora cactorum]|uniref:Uncharacterized protein n=1 Tax=Phytophthora cactorum TaxID=29920 RepID=A0A8T1FPW7_9STRA|nr:hypothetical protein PC118_g13174 [Phytophthora cactorum]